jgi:hypothetical protein
VPIADYVSADGANKWSAAGGLTAVLANGEMRQYNMAALEEGRGTLVERLRAADADLMPAMPAPEIGYWNPAIRTDETGQARVTFALPERSTSWKLEAKGVTLETLAGDAESQLVTKKELFGELKLPMAFTDGDSANIIATVHSEKRDRGGIDVTLKTTIGDKTIEQTQKIDAPAGTPRELVFETKLVRPDRVDHQAEVLVTFELIVSAQGQADRYVRALPLEPFGLPVFGVASGMASSDTTAWVELPRGMPASSPSLEILIGATVERGLLDILLGTAPRCQLVNSAWAPSSDAVSSDLMAGIALQRLWGTTRDADSPHATAIDSRIRSAIGQLVAAQHDQSCSWSWRQAAPRVRCLSC